MIHLVGLVARSKSENLKFMKTISLYKLKVGIVKKPVCLAHTIRCSIRSITSGSMDYINLNVDDSAIDRGGQKWLQHKKSIISKQSVNLILQKKQSINCQVTKSVQQSSETAFSSQNKSAWPWSSKANVALLNKRSMMLHVGSKKFAVAKKNSSLHETRNHLSFLDNIRSTKLSDDEVGYCRPHPRLSQTRHLGSKQLLFQASENEKY